MTIPFRNVATFVCCAENGSFSKAALHLGMTPQAISSQIKQLEEWLGVRIFNRTTRKISLTEEGRHFFERCKTGLESIEEGIRGARESTDEAVGTVRLSMPFGISRGYILPMLSTFFARYPKVSVELITQDTSVDIIDQSVDLGIASRSVPGSSLIVRKLASAELVLCASAEYIEKYGTPKNIDALRRFRCITLRHPKDGKMMPWTFRKGKELINIDITGCIVTSDTETHRHAVLQGLGIGQVASFFVRAHMRTGRLVPISLGYEAPPIEFFLYMPQRMQIPKKTRALADHVFREFRRNPDFVPLR